MKNDSPSSALPPSLPSHRACPICKSREYTLFASRKIDESRLNEYSYASRKTPEFMRHKLVTCSRCRCVYAPSPVERHHLEQAYHQAEYDSSDEANCAAASYAAELRPFVTSLAHRHMAVDVGAGNGALLPYLEQMGFAPAVGVEPSREAIKVAPDAIRGQLIEGMFSPEILPAQPLSLFCSFATLEHVDTPLQLLEDAYSLLEPGGLIALSTHNYAGMLNRMLGLRSPIVDIEHLQLYCPKTLEFALDACGFTDIEIQSFTNRYPIKYWLRLLPLPQSIKRHVLSALQWTGVSETLMSIPVGNLFAVAKKASAPDTWS